jgi:C4-dicarboxylate-specific signal transduction histidine kinase
MTPEEEARLRQVALMAAGLAHDFNNSAMCLLSELATLEARLAELRRFMAATLDLDVAAKPLRVLEACARSIETVDAGMQIAVVNNRELQRLYRGEQRPPQSTGADLRRAAQRALRLVGNRLRSIAQLHDGEPIRVAAHEDTIVRVLLNLLINASDAFPSDATMPRVRLEISSHGSRAYCDVIDNGPGVSPEILSRLFQPFATTKGTSSGAGLGLAVSRDLVRATDGELLLLETSRTGTTFRLILPTLATAHESGPGSRGSSQLRVSVSAVLTPPPHKERDEGLAAAPRVPAALALTPRAE